MSLESQPDCSNQVIAYVTEGIVMPETTTVVAVKLRYSPRSLWFDPVLGDYAVGDPVLVETERGREVGKVSAVDIQATEQQIAALPSALKPVIRMLDEKDLDLQTRLEEKSEAALAVFHELIEKSDLEIKPVAVEYLFTGDKAVFYFASDARVDFRELVRELASRLHIRVELRQIGVRDEARMLGGISHCGETLCCARLGADFQPVSIRMAKEQDLPLNPEKISGVCGRLMCCLRYEFESYRDFKGRAPRRGTEITTPLGPARVIDYNTPRESVTMQLEDGKSFSVPLNEFDRSDTNGKEQAYPDSVGREALERSANNSLLLALSALDREAVIDEIVQSEAGSQVPDTRRRRNRRESTRSGQAEQDSQTAAAVKDNGSNATSERSSHRNRRRSQTAKTDQAVKPTQSVSPADGSEQQSANRSQSQVRPGQNSSGLRRSNSNASNQRSNRSQGSGSQSGDGRRRRRRQSNSDSDSEK